LLEACLKQYLIINILYADQAGVELPSTKHNFPLAWLRQSVVVTGLSRPVNQLVTVYRITWYPETT